jgi:predicted permease
MEREMDLELRSHIEHRAEDLIREGIPLRDALRRARSELGAIEARKDECREEVGLRLMDEAKADLRYAFRRLRQSPGFTLTALSAIALGIGANTAIFSVVNAVLLRPLPVPDSDRLVILTNTAPKGMNLAASPAKFQYWRTQTSVLEDISASRFGVMNYTGGPAPQQLRSAHVTPGYFHCLRAQTEIGRTFTNDEDAPNGPHVAVLGHDFWSREFASDPKVLGKAITLNGDPYTVIGVLAASFDMPEFQPYFAVLLPFQLDPGDQSQGNYFEVTARLKPGISLQQARSQVQLSAVGFRSMHPNALPPGFSFSVTPFWETLELNVRPSLLVLEAAVGLVLLIACANVANLLLVRAAGRRREIGIRLAIGAGRARIVRQLLVESAMLSLTGGALGLALGFAGIRALLAVNTAGLPRVGEAGSLVSVDWRVLAFTLCVSILTGILFGLLPALQGSRSDVNRVLKEGSGRSGPGYRQSKTLSLLVASELSIAVILLVGSVLLIRSSVALAGVDPGFNTQNVLTMRMAVTGRQFANAAAVDRLVQTGSARLRALPGVTAVSASCCVPMQQEYGLPFIIAGRPWDPTAQRGGAWITVSPGFFDVFGIPIQRGRALTERDDRDAPPVVVINETMARQFWKDSDPLKDRLIIGRGLMGEFRTEPERQIVGIARDVRSLGLDGPVTPAMYVPQAQLSDAVSAFNLRITPMAWLVRTEGPPQRLASGIQQQLSEATGLPVSGVAPMSEVISQSTARRRFNMLLMTIFGGCALLLAAIGIYGLVSYSVEQRAQEIGIRIALGAGAGQVRKRVVRQGMLLALAGVGIGVGAALGLTRFLATLLYGVGARDPIVFLSVALLLSAVAFFAVWSPASRASRIDPIEALRHE